MRLYEIKDDENVRSVGTLIYYEKAGAFIIELQEYLDEWTAPLLFTKYVKDGIYTIPRDISFLWVRERIVPESRQNIGSILSRHRLKAYDEMKFLEISNGRCSQDSMYIKRIGEMPAYVSERVSKNLTDCIPLDDHILLCFFAEGTVKKVSLGKLTSVKDIDKLLRNEDLYLSCTIGPGGYSATFNDSIDIPASLLYTAAESIPFCASDFITFAQRGLTDTTESCGILECSRQNLDYMLSRNQLRPVKNDVKGNLYLKGDVISKRW